MSNASKSAEAAPFSSKQLERAVGQFRQAIKLAPWDLQARFLLAKALERLGHVEEALAVLTEIICLDPNNLPARRAIQQLRGRGDEPKDD